MNYCLLKINNMHLENRLNFNFMPTLICLCVGAEASRMGVLVPSESYRVSGQGAGDAKNSGIFDSLLDARLCLYAFSSECLEMNSQVVFLLD